MDTEKLVSITISIPKVYRDQLRRIVAEGNLKNLDEATTVSRLVKGIICGYLKELKKEGGIRNEQSTSDC
jgi:hypothetical protein